jgi:histidine triad (HIT) family protein
MATDCLFCKMVSGTIKPDVVYQDKDVLAFKDINPQAPLHVLIVPKKHIATLNDLSEADSGIIARLYLAGQKIARDAGVAEKGYRTVINCNADAGQSVFHIHLHVLGGRLMGWPPG